MTQLFDYAMDIGEQMLISGAEVHRVEESINRMCYALGAERVDVFIITSSMVVTVYTQDDTAYTRTRRVTTMKFNIERLHKLNALSRQICEKEMTGEEIQLKLNEAINCKPFPALLEFISSAVIAGAFTLFFGGNVLETVISFFVGIHIPTFCNHCIFVGCSTRLLFITFKIITKYDFVCIRIGYKSSCQHRTTDNRQCKKYHT